MRLAIATALVLLAAAAAALAGPGQTVEIKTTVLIRDSAPAFHGKVRAKNQNCVEDRTVKMFREAGAGRRLLGKTQTSNAGKWKISVDPLKSGAYYAAAKRVEQGTAGTIYVCTRARSETIIVD
ncbi:MAG TPA: hypothetical protein VK326_09790 [Solirubrobacterales bacterium]|nr:hypothetical protein [Solirubrobacterales bacterium]